MYNVFFKLCFRVHRYYYENTHTQWQRATKGLEARIWYTKDSLELVCILQVAIAAYVGLTYMEVICAVRDGYDPAWECS